MSDGAPTEVRLRRAERAVEVRWPDGANHVLPAEYLRVESPSAEVQGHGPGQKTLVAGLAVAEVGEKADAHAGKPKGGQLGVDGGNAEQHPRQAHLLGVQKARHQQGGIDEAQPQPEVGNNGIAQPLALNDAQMDLVI